MRPRSLPQSKITFISRGEKGPDVAELVPAPWLHRHKKNYVFRFNRSQLSLPQILGGFE